MRRQLTYVLGAMILLAAIAIATSTKHAYAENDPCFSSCEDGAYQTYIENKRQYCEYLTSVENISHNWNSYCNEGGYGYSCTPNGVYIPPGCQSPSCIQRGTGFGGGGQISSSCSP